MRGIYFLIGTEELSSCQTMKLCWLIPKSIQPRNSQQAESGQYFKFDLYLYIYTFFSTFDLPLTKSWRGIFRASVDAWNQRQHRIHLHELVIIPPWLGFFWNSKLVFLLQDFVMGLSILLRGTIQEKLNWAFNLYDINKDGYITKEVCPLWGGRLTVLKLPLKPFNSIFLVFLLLR